MSGTGKRRRKFTPEYRYEAAHLVIDTGRTIAAVAAEIDVSEQSLGKWVRAEREKCGQPDGPLSAGERAELVRLREENARLRMDNEFLGKAAVYFASKNTRRSVSS
jgi:transposase